MLLTLALRRTLAITGPPLCGRFSVRGWINVTVDNGPDGSYGLESAIRGSGFVHGPLAGQEQGRLVPVELSLRDQEGPGLHRAAMNMDA